ncbi:Tricalbin-2 [Massospora cicadina]|nr:Tricalbin-2 [Massospora cicadina]
MELPDPAAVAQEVVQTKIADATSTSAPIQIVQDEGLIGTGSSQATHQASKGATTNEPLVHVTLDEQAQTGIFLSGGADPSTKAPADDEKPCIGWQQLADRNLKLENAIVQNQVAHWRNVTVIYVAVVLTWLGVVLGGGFSWCLLVIGGCSTYYMNTVERYRRAARDDAIRELWVQKLENEVESVGWLNNFLGRFWVIYEPGLSATIKSIVDSVLESLSLTTFQLGNKAPRIHSVKTYPKTEMDNVLMDWDFEFQPNYDPDMTQRQIDNQIYPKVILQIRVGKGFVGAGMPILVENFALKGKMRVRINFGAQFPHISVVGLQFLDRPAIDYVLKPVGGDTFGFDIAHIPGLSTFISDQIHAVLNPMMYQPNRFVLNVAEMLNAAQQNQVAGVLRVNVRYARNLKFKDGSGDPFVEVSGSTKAQTFKTKVIRNTNRPSWDEVHSVVIYTGDESLNFAVVDYNPILKNIACGSAQLPLSEFLTKPTQNGLALTLRREQLYVGDLILDCQFYPALAEPKPEEVDSTSAQPCGVLRFTLHQIKDLDASKSLIGKYTPYVYMLVNGVEVHQTMKKKRTNSPVYEETADCIVTNLSSATLALTIMDDKGLAADPVVAQWSMPATKVFQSNGWFSLNNVASGKVKVTARWFPVEMGASNSLLSKTPAHHFGMVELHLMEAPQLKLLGPRSEVSVGISVSDTYRSSSSRLRGDTVPRWNQHQPFYVPVFSPTDIVQLDVIEHSDGGKVLVGSVEHSVLQLVHRSGEDYESKGLLNFWAPLVTKADRVQGLLHFGSCFHLASPPSAIKEVPASCIINFVVHGARNLPPGDVRAAAFISGKNSHLVAETSVQAGTAAPVWDQPASVLVRDTREDVLSIVVQDKKAASLGRWEMVVQDLLKQQDGSRVWLPLGNGSEVEVSFKVQLVAFEDHAGPDVSQMLGCGRLTVDLIRATGLVGVDASGTSDPFVKARINGVRVFKSQVVKKNLDPVYNERFTVPILEAAGSFLVFELEPPLSDLALESPIARSYPLEGNNRGTLHLQLSFVSATLSDEELAQAASYRVGGTLPRHGARASIHSQGGAVDRSHAQNSVLTVVSAEQILDEAATGALRPIKSAATGRAGKLQIKIISAEKLAGVDRSGTSDPYVKLKHDGKTLFQTKTIYKVCNPTWDETCTVDLPDGSPYWLHLSVMDYNRVHSDRNLGDLLINVWDHVDANDRAAFQSTFWTRELNGGEPGRVQLELTYIP